MEPKNCWRDRHAVAELGEGHEAGRRGDEEDEAGDDGGDEDEGSGGMGATLKRRRMSVSRSLVARMPAPKKAVAEDADDMVTMMTTWRIAPAGFGAERLREDEEEGQGHEVVEKDDDTFVGGKAESDMV